MCVTDGKGIFDGRLLVVAFEGWNDAGEAATGAVGLLKEQLSLSLVYEVDPELYFDYQFNRPTLTTDADGTRRLEWPAASMYGPAARSDGAAGGEHAPGEGAHHENIYVLVGTEPSRAWKSFCAEFLDAALTHEIGAIVFLGSMLADTPHTRPIHVSSSSDDEEVRAALGVERSEYEGPVGILSALADAASQAGIPTVSIWASVPHYVQHSPSPKAALALVDKLEEIVDVVIPRGDLIQRSEEWERSIDALAAEDEDMASYIQQLESARDTVEAPEASGEAIAREFERYLRSSDDPDDEGPSAS